MAVFFEIIIFILRIYSYILFFRLILSWFRINPGSGFLGRIYKFLFDITEPFLVLFRKIIPLVRIGRGYLDLSYIAAILVIQLITVLLRYVAVRYI
jgi:YggT family protein